MCCYRDRKFEEKFCKKYAKQKQLYAWKELTPYGCGRHSEYQYSPGHHKMKRPVKRYIWNRPKGFHVWWRRPPTVSGYWSLRVIVDPKELIVADEDEGVFQSVRITKAAWKNAGLPELSKDRINSVKRRKHEVE